MSCLVILAAAVFAISCGTTDSTKITLSDISSSSSIVSGSDVSLVVALMRSYGLHQTPAPQWFYYDYHVASVNRHQWSDYSATTRYCIMLIWTDGEPADTPLRIRALPPTVRKSILVMGHVYTHFDWRNRPSGIPTPPAVYLPDCRFQNRTISAGPPTTVILTRRISFRFMHIIQTITTLFSRRSFVCIKEITVANVRYPRGKNRRK